MTNKFSKQQKVKDKCSNCGSIKTSTFWDYEDESMLCDKCHKRVGGLWQKDIDNSKISTSEIYNKKDNQSSFGKKILFATLIIALVIFAMFLYFISTTDIKTYNSFEPCKGVYYGSDLPPYKQTQICTHTCEILDKKYFASHCFDYLKCSCK